MIHTKSNQASKFLDGTKQQVYARVWRTGKLLLRMGSIAGTIQLKTDEEDAVKDQERKDGGEAEVKKMLQAFRFPSNSECYQLHLQLP